MTAMNFWSTSSEIIIQEAHALGLEVDIIDKDTNFYTISNDKKEIFFKNTDFGVNSALGFKLVQDKSLCYTLLERYNFSIAKSVYLPSEHFYNFSEDSISQLQFPLVIKPLSEAHGNGVCMNIYSYNELKEKLTHSFENYECMIIQEQIEGDEIRIVLHDDKMLAAYIRKPPYVIGDSISTIEELIHQENESNPLRGPQYENVLCNIEIDSEVLNTLEKQSLGLSSTPKKGECIFVRTNSNVGTGGSLIDVSHILHDDIKKTAIEACKIFGLGFAGVDIIIKDVTKPLTKDNGVILEINATPGISGHKEILNLNTGRNILRTLFHI